MKYLKLKFVCITLRRVSTPEIVLLLKGKKISDLIRELYKTKILFTPTCKKFETLPKNSLSTVTTFKPIKFLI